MRRGGTGDSTFPSRVTSLAGSQQTLYILKRLLYPERCNDKTKSVQAHFNNFGSFQGVVLLIILICRRKILDAN